MELSVIGEHLQPLKLEDDNLICKTNSIKTIGDVASLLKLKPNNLSNISLHQINEIKINEEKSGSISIDIINPQECKVEGIIETKTDNEDKLDVLPDLTTGPKIYEKYPKSVPQKLKHLFSCGCLRGNSSPGFKRGFYKQEGFNSNRKASTDEPMRKEKKKINIRTRRKNFFHKNNNDPFAEGFDDQRSRREFVKFVYMILMVQLTVVLLYVIASHYITPLRDFYRTIYGLIAAIVAAIFAFIFIIILMCCGNLRQIKPWNFILLGIITILTAFEMGFFAARIDEKIVWISLGSTILILFVTTVIAVYSPIDITGYGIYLIIITFALALLGLIAVIVYLFTQIKLIMLIYCSIGVLLFSVWIIFDTQMIVGGRNYELEVDEYIAGSLSLFIDVIQILTFVFLIGDLTSN